MTQSHKLKKTIRTRARKTGESVSAARRMVLKQKPRVPVATRTSATASERAVGASTLSAALLKSEPRLVARTGHGWEHWFTALDRFGAQEKGRDPGARALWAATLEPELRAALEAAVAGPAGLRERERGGARLRLKVASGVAVALSLDPKPNGKSSLVAQSMKLEAAADIVRYRATWKEAFAALGRQFA